MLVMSLSCQCFYFTPKELILLPFDRSTPPHVTSHNLFSVKTAGAQNLNTSCHPQAATWNLEELEICYFS